MLKWSSPPVVDLLVSRLKHNSGSGGRIPLQGACGQKVSTARSLFLVDGAQYCPCCYVMITDWSKHLCRGLKDLKVSPKCIALVDQRTNALQFIYDAFLDAALLFLVISL